MAPRRSGRRRTKPSSRWAIPTSVASALTSGAAPRPARGGGRLPPLGRGGAVGRAVEQADARERARVDGQGERAALAGDAPDLQVAAQHAGEPFRDREPEARAPEAPRGRGVGLREGCEEPRLLFGVEADAGVDDLQAEAAGRPRVRRESDPEAHAPP